MNVVIIVGRLTRDPDLRQTNSGVSCARFSIAVDRQFKNQQTGEREADFIDCVAWRQTADFVTRYFTKGQMIAIEGDIRNNNYDDKNGVKHYSYTVNVNQVHFVGSKNEQSGEQQQTTTYQQQTAANAAPTQSPAQSAPALNLDEFEQILGDDEPPF